jgi:hypothetical protein
MRELITGRAFACHSCGGSSELSTDLRRAFAGIAFFVATLLLSLVVGGGAVYNREMFVRYPPLSWGLVVTVALLVAYLLYAIRKPLRKLPSSAKPAP